MSITYFSSRAAKRASSNTRPPPPLRIERLEHRQLLAAHVLGSPIAYSTIQSAINAAPVGGTVVVDHGVFPDLVTVDKPLTLRGVQAGKDARKRLLPSSATESILTGSPLATGVRSTSFYISANDVTIDGFDIRQSNSASVYGAAIVIAPGVSGTHLLNNIIADNSVGLYLANASAADPAVVQHNAFIANIRASAHGGTAVYSDATVAGGALAGVNIDSNTFTGNTTAAIALDSSADAGQSDISITNNVMTADAIGIQIRNASGVAITGNQFTASTVVAIDTDSSVTQLTLTSNALPKAHGKPAKPHENNGNGKAHHVVAAPEPPKARKPKPAKPMNIMNENGDDSQEREDVPPR